MNFLNCLHIITQNYSTIYSTLNITAKHNQKIIKLYRLNLTTIFYVNIINFFVLMELNERTQNIKVPDHNFKPFL